MPVAPSSRRIGFTLIELLVVLAIIGVIISLILVAAADGVRRAEEKQTLTMLTKIDNAVTDRIDALLATTAPINQTHRYLASLTYLNVNGIQATNNNDPVTNSDSRRAQIIAQMDYMKAELPDVFFLNPPAYSSLYPLNFAASPYPLTNPNGVHDFALPLGNASPGLPYTGVVNTPGYNTPTPGFNPFTGYNNAATGLIVAQDSGIFGASFTAAAGIYKNLYEAAAQDLLTALGPGYVVNTKAGYDAVDNNSNGLVDDLPEVQVTPAPATPFASFVANRLAKHTHNTARAEALYGLLVEGQGPLGSVFNRDEFTSREVGDTDGDGMLEFIDAWGQPIQFYRWPIYYGSRTTYSTATSDSQKGYDSYASTEARQLDPLDPNQLLVAPAWWTSTTLAGTTINSALPGMTGATVPDFSSGLAINGPTGGKIFNGSTASGQANAFMTYLKILVDPGGNTWDRTGSSARREYYSRFLIVSSGPDKVPGTFQLGLDYSQFDPPPGATVPNAGPVPATGFPQASSISDIIVYSTLMNWCEGQAAQVDYGARSGTFLQGVSQTTTAQYLQQVSGMDDITNHAISSPGAAAK